MKEQLVLNTCVTVDIIFVLHAVQIKYTTHFHSYNTSTAV